MPLSVRPHRALIAFLALSALALVLAVLVSGTTRSVALSSQTGQYLHFTGPDAGYITVPDAPALNPATEISIEAWVFLDSYESIPPMENCQSFAGKDYYTSYWLGECGGKIRFYAHDMSYVDGVGMIPLHTWAHIAVTYDGATTNLYIDGVLDHSDNSISGPLASNASPVHIGGDVNYDLSPDNRIDAVQLWSVARTALDISADMATITTPQAGLIAVWNMENSTGSDVGGFTGTLVGDAEFAPPLEVFDKGDTNCDHSITAADALPILGDIAGTSGYLAPCVGGPVLTSIQGIAQWWDASSGNGYIEVPDDPALNPANAITIELWVYLGSYRSPDNGSACASLAGKGYTTAYWFGVCSGYLRFYPRGSGSSVNSDGAVPLRTWAHVAVVADQTNVKFYINGELDSEFTNDAAPLTTSSDPLRIGSDADYDHQPWAAMYEVRIWNVARTQAEIQDTMHDVIAPPPTGLIAAYHLAVDAADAANGHNGVAVGTVAYGTSLPAPYWPDIDCDGLLTASDLLPLIAYVAGVGESFPLDHSCEAIGTPTG